MNNTDNQTNRNDSRNTYRNPDEVNTYVRRKPDADRQVSSARNTSAPVNKAPESSRPYRPSVPSQTAPSAGQKPVGRKPAGNPVNDRNAASRSGKPADSKNKKTPEKRPPRKPAPSEMTPEMIRAEKRKAAKKKMFLRNFGRVSAIMAVVVFISLSIATVVISCVNDILAVHIPEKRDTATSVIITDNMNTEQVIDALGEVGLIKNPWFCKIAADFIGYSEDGYIARTYDLRRSMGLENMLNEIKNNTSKTAKTVKLTFPEGYNVDQIVELLEENKVCTRAAFVETMNTVDFSSDFDFLATMTDVESRYMRLEGYLFPDTYEFYIGEDPASVIRKFLNNFENKWNSDYATKAQKLRLSVDQVIKLASVVEKEAVGEDMPVVGSILHNRIAAGMRLDCDSTSSYINSNKSGLSQEQIDALDPLYDTYVCKGLPVGAICNPGTDSIEAILNAPETDYYYFIHDANNEFHVAKTLTEQEYNIATYGLAE